jgi:coenzyme F420 hydrogenase subunit beta
MSDRVPPSVAVSLESIVEGGLCMGCGLCQSLAGTDRVRLQMKGEHGERPVLRGKLDAVTLAAIDQACPGVALVGSIPSQ